MLHNSCKCQRALFPICNSDLGLIAVPINCMLGTNGNCSYDYANPKNYAFPNNICKVQEQQVRTRSSTVPWYRQVESSCGNFHGTDTQRQEVAHFHGTVPWTRSNTYGQVVVKFQGTGARYRDRLWYSSMVQANRNKKWYIDRTTIVVQWLSGTVLWCTSNR